MLAAASLSLARAVDQIVLRLGGAGAVEQGFAALLGFEARKRERLVERDRGLGRLARRNPHIARRRPQMGGRRILVGRGQGRLFERRRRGCVVAAPLRGQRAADESIGADKVGAR